MIGKIRCCKPISHKGRDQIEERVPDAVAAAKNAGLLPLRDPQNVQTEYRVGCDIAKITCFVLCQRRNIGYDNQKPSGWRFNVMGIS